MYRFPKGHILTSKRISVTGFALFILSQSTGRLTSRTLFLHVPHGLIRTVQAIATYANVQMNYARGGDPFASMALQSTDACISQERQQTDQAAERVLVLLPEQTCKWHTAQRGT